jgi:hypothetical protein
MSEKLELSPRKDVKSANLMDNRTRYTISLGIGCLLGLSAFLMVSAINTWSYPEAEVRNVVADCKASVIEFVPLGAYPGGSQQVITALNYCGTLG